MNTHDDAPQSNDDYDLETVRLFVTLLQKSSGRFTWGNDTDWIALMKRRKASAALEIAWQAVFRETLPKAMLVLIEDFVLGVMFYRTALDTKNSRSSS